MEGVSEKKTDRKEAFGISDIINILGSDFSNIYLVDREDRSVEVYRYENEVGIKEDLHKKQPYKSAMQTYIEVNVCPEDKKKMLAAMDLQHVCAQLRQVPQFTVHYRVKRDGALLYYYMKCARIGDAENFQQIVFAFASEDTDVRRSELEKIVHSDIAGGKRKILVIEDNLLDREMLCTILKDKYEILTAENGEIGFELLEQHYKELSVVLLDMQMPVCNGTEFLMRVQEDNQLSVVPIIVITASEDTGAELNCLNLGASDFIKKPYNADIVRGRVGNVIRLKESALTLAAVEHDELTGLYTEQAFLHYAKTILKFKPDTPMRMVVAKIKDFQLLQNIYGTRKADEMLCCVASVYSNATKQGLVARKESAAFVGLFWGDDREFPQKLKDAIRQMAERSPIKGWKVKYGVYENIDKSLPIATICDYAQMAEESIVDNYDCDVAYYTEEMAHKRIYDQMMENDFEAALEGQEFVVYYQPKVEIATEKVVGAEALVRWKKDEKSMISPADFIPLFEKDGLIVKLDEYVFRKVCAFQRKTMEEGAELLPISVNLSRSSILHQDVAQRYIQIVRENGIPYSCVPIELTESAAIYNNRIKMTTGQLTDAGFVLHIDDFGAGYSSLICLNQFPFSTLKIDKSLIDDVCQRKGKTLVEQVITLSKLLDMKVVAEGVETRQQLDVVKALKCDAVQGFYYAKPMPEKEFLEYIRNK